MSKDLPLANWIPGVHSGSLDKRAIVDTPLNSVATTTSQTQRIWSGMLQSRQTWVRLPMRQRVQRLAAVCAVLHRDGAGSDAQQLAASTGLSAQGMQAAWEVTFAPWTESSLLEMLRCEELDSGVQDDGVQLPQCVVHILAGNVLPPTWSLLVRGWLLGATQWLRPSAREPLFAGCVLRRVATLDADLASMTAVTWWPHVADGLDPMARDVLGQADVVTAHGDDASIANIEASLRDLPGSRRFLGYGSRWSCAVLGPEDLTQDAAEGIAHDVALFDQQGCLSPTFVFVKEGAPVEAWCDRLAQAMACKQQELPRGEPGARARASLRHHMECMRLAQAQGRLRLWAPASGTDWSVGLTRDLETHDSPLDRHLLVHAVGAAADLRPLFAGRLGSVQGLAVRRVESMDDWCREFLQVLRPTRVAVVGTLQLAPPAWCQDHLPPLRSLMTDPVSGS